MAESLLTIEGLSAGYGDVRVLWDISLAVQAGEITCIVGSNGAGKTTLLRTISGLVKADAGQMARVERRLRRKGGLREGLIERQ